MVKFIKNNLFFCKLVGLGLFFVLLAAALSCGPLGLVNHFAEPKCGKVALLTNFILPRDNTLSYGLLFFSFIALAMWLKKNIIFKQRLNVSFCPWLIFLKICQFVFKSFNPILEAFRQGILHRQIYNFAIIID